jgi:tRNA(His) guanylyltransferase
MIMVETATQTMGERMKAYEKEFRSTVPSKNHVIVRLDGKAFHSYTRGLDRPYDQKLMDDMDAVAAHLCDSISGVKFAYVQSDEISLLLTDWGFGAVDNTEAYFGNQIQKIVSVAASTASAVMNILRPPTSFSTAAVFDARMFTLPSKDETEAYFIWRQRDAIKNSVTMAASTKVSDKALMGVTTAERLALLEDHGYSWDTLPAGFRYGRIIIRKTEEEPVTFTHRKTGEVHSVMAVRSKWVSEPAFNEVDPNEVVFRKFVPEKREH